MKTLHLQRKAKTFEDLFTDTLYFNDLKTAQKFTIDNPEYYHIHMNQLNNGYISFCVKPSQLLQDFIDLQKGTKEDTYTYSIKFIQRSDLSTLITFSIDQLIFSTWLCIFDYNSLPDKIKPIKPVNHAVEPCITYIHHIAHGNGLAQLIYLLGKYKSTFIDVDSLPDKASAELIDIRGNFEDFSLSYHIETNDFNLISTIKDKVLNCSNAEIVETKDIFKSMRV